MIPVSVIIFFSKTSPRNDIISIFLLFFVSKATLSIIVKTLNQQTPKLLDESCITNFLRMEGSIKWSNKENKYIPNSQYRLINDKLTWKEIYNKIYNFNQPETEPTNPFENTETKPSKQTNKISETSSSKIDALCNKITGLNALWRVNQTNNNCCLLFATNSNLCCIETDHEHSDSNHSWMQINKSKGSKLACHSHSHRELESCPLLKHLKQELGLIKGEKDKNNFQTLLEYVENIAKKDKLTRCGGYMMKRNDKIPIMYDRLMKYEDFINETFAFAVDESITHLFNKSSKVFFNLLDYFSHTQNKHFRFLQINPDIFAFNNGYLDISDLYNVKFEPYTDDLKLVTTKHFDIDFEREWLEEEDFSTPLFDKIINHHFSADITDEEERQVVYNSFFGMIGRLHYPVHKYDEFNCLFYVKGGSNTGKSTIGNIITSNHQNKGTISGTFEKKFGFQNLIDKNLIYVQECPENIHLNLTKTDFQRTIEGSTIDVARKNLPSINNFEWKIPQLWLGNFFPKYNDKSGAIPRRLCSFFMDIPINSEEKNTKLEAQCIKQEGHLVLLKSLSKYRDLISTFEDKTFEDWGKQYDYFKRGYEEAKEEVDDMYNFLNLGYNEFECWFVNDPDSSIIVKGEYMDDKLISRYGFIKLFNKYLYFNGNKKGIKSLNDYKTTILKQGYKIVKRKTCKFCGKVANGKSEKEKCCDEYYKCKDKRKNRKEVSRIEGIKVIYKQKNF